ncbi:unnamed protein product [Clonostachys byssicola]|uniref:Uncharacterized protein n=1 Tax=Clonostachys byssicola TaxID=160290 RepID=A0A9N9UF60_9HYPO|nr:unnamed protein product [Clonostachys byssicola]
MDELDAFRQGIVELEEVVQEARAELHRLLEKSDVNKEFLSKLTDMGKLTSHFRRTQGTVRDMELAERALYQDLMVLVANNRLKVDQQSATIQERLPTMEAELQELKDQYRREQGEQNFLARLIPEQQVNAEEDSSGDDPSSENGESQEAESSDEDLSREDGESQEADSSDNDLSRKDGEAQEVSNPDDAGDIL